MSDDFESRYGDTLRRMKINYSVPETLERVEAAIRGRGLKFFGCLDHAAAAEEYGLEMPPATVFLFGNPKLGTPSMIECPEFAIEAPPKGLVYQDGDGQVWIAYNTAEYLFGTIYGRHGITMSEDIWAGFNNMLKEACEEAAG
jgi:uncharacterized protein (DUF302 family)